MAIDLITRTEYKQYLGIQSATKDAEIDLLIPKVSSLVKTYCRRTFIDYYNDPKIEVFDGGYDRIVLSETPVREILGVRRSENYGQTYTSLVEYEDWAQDNLGVRAVGNLNYFKQLVNGYRITYLGGFDEIPEDLKLAVMDIVEYYSKNNSAVHVNRDVTPNVTQIQYVATTNFPAHIKRILDQYVADYS